MKGALLIVSRAGGPVWFGTWRDASGRQVKRRLGPRDDAARITKVFESSVAEAQTRELER